MNGHDLVIRRFESIHLAEVVKIEATSTEQFWNAEVFTRHLSQKNHDGLVAYRGEEIVGFVAHEKLKKPKVLCILNLVVRPQDRRTGVGHRLIERLKSMYPIGPFDGFRINIRESNLVAQRFFQKHKFWCYAISRDYFEDRWPEGVQVEDAYCLDYNPAVERKDKDVPFIITDRYGIPLANRSTCRRNPNTHAEWVGGS